MSVGLRGKTWAAIVALSAIAGLGGCASTEDAAPRRSAPASATVTVTVDTFMFGPKVTRVKAGTSVRWTNRDDILHTVTSGTRQYDPGDSGRVIASRPDGAFDLSLDGRGASASFVFGEVGTYHYFCNRHPGMEAEVDVS